MQALILAAGKGTRMRSTLPKVLHKILGRPLLAYVCETLMGLGVRNPKVVVGSGADQVRSFLKEFAKQHKGFSPTCLLQREQKGTGHAVEIARSAFRSYKGDILIWPGDMPLVKRDSLVALIKQHRKYKNEVSVLSSLQPDPTGYGRMLRAGGQFYAIREELDASEAERRIQEVNSGIYLFKSGALYQSLKKVKTSNAKKEYYLTDTIEVLAEEDRPMDAYPFAGAEEAQGINSRVELAMGTKTFREREIQKHMENGVTVVAPEQTYIEPGVRIGSDTVIQPWTYIEAGVRIGKGCQIGPFAKIRKGTEIQDDSVIGSFVEVSRSRIGKKVLAKHLSYIGDAVIGDGTNIGAGVITANYDGKRKHVTKIGKKTRVGSNTVFVAPVTVGNQCVTGAGSVLVGGKFKKGEVVVGIPAKPIVRKNGKKKKR